MLSPLPYYVRYYVTNATKLDESDPTITLAAVPLPGNSHTPPKPTSTPSHD